MIAPDDPRHGTVAGHLAGCGNDRSCCAAAMARYKKRRTYDAHIGKPRTVAAIGTRRRVQALQALGWSYTAIGARCNTDNRVLQRIAAKQIVILHTTALRIAAVYDQMSMELPDPQTRGERISVVKARNHAQRMGYLPPLCWDDATIDNPDAKPYKPRSRKGADPELHQIDPVIVERAMNGERVKANVAERAEVVRRWLAAGRSRNALEAAQGWNTTRDNRKSAA